MKMAYMVSGKTCNQIKVGGTTIEVGDVHWKYGRRHMVQIIVDDCSLSHCLRLMEEEAGDLIRILGVSLKEVKRRNRPCKKERRQGPAQYQQRHTPNSAAASGDD